MDSQNVLPDVLGIGGTSSGDTAEERRLRQNRERVRRHWNNQSEAKKEEVRKKDREWHKANDARLHTRAKHH